MNKAQLFITWLDGQLDGVTECDTERTKRIEERLESIFEKHVEDPSKPIEIVHTTDTFPTNFLGEDENGVKYRC